MVTLIKFRKMFRWALICLCLIPGAGYAEKPTLSMEECVLIAIRQNPRAQAVLAGLEEAVGLSTAAKSGFIPKLDVNAYYQYRENDFGDSTDLPTVQREIAYVEQLGAALATPGTPLPAPIGRDVNIRREDYNLTVRISQNIFSSGRVRSQVAIAKMAEERLMYVYQATLNELVLETRLAFLSALLARDSIGVQQEAISRQRTELALQEGQFEAGIVGELNVMRASVSLATFQPALLDAEAAYEQALLELASLMAIPLDPESGALPFRIVGTLEPVAPSIDLPNALGRATAMRPEIQAQMKAIEMLKRQIVVERSQILPQVDVFASYEFYSELDKNQPNANVSTYTVGVTGNWQIFDGLEAAGRIKATRARITAAEHVLEEIRILVQKQVRSAFLSYDGALRAYNATLKVKGLTNETLNSVQASYQAGLSSQIEVLQAQIQAASSAESTLRARFSLNASIAQLNSAIGVEMVLNGNAEQVKIPVAAP